MIGLLLFVSTAFAHVSLTKEEHDINCEIQHRRRCDKGRKEHVNRKEVGDHTGSSSNVISENRGCNRNNITDEGTVKEERGGQQYIDDNNLESSKNRLNENSTVKIMDHHRSPHEVYNMLWHRYWDTNRALMKKIVRLENALVCKLHEVCEKLPMNALANCEKVRDTNDVLIKKAMQLENVLACKIHNICDKLPATLQNSSRTKLLGELKDIVSSNLQRLPLLPFHYADTDTASGSGRIKDKASDKPNNVQRMLGNPQGEKESSENSCSETDQEDDDESSGVSSSSSLLNDNKKEAKLDQIQEDKLNTSRTYSSTEIEIEAKGSDEFFNKDQDGLDACSKPIIEDVRQKVDGSCVKTELVNSVKGALKKNEDDVTYNQNDQGNHVVQSEQSDIFNNYVANVVSRPKKASNIPPSSSTVRQKIEQENHGISSECPPTIAGKGKANNEAADECLNSIQGVGAHQEVIIEVDENINNFANHDEATDERQSTGVQGVGAHHGADSMMDQTVNNSNIEDETTDEYQTAGIQGVGAHQALKDKTVGDETADEFQPTGIQGVSAHPKYIIENETNDKNKAVVDEEQLAAKNFPYQYSSRGDNELNENQNILEEKQQQCDRDDVENNRSEIVSSSGEQINASATDSDGKVKSPFMGLRRNFINVFADSKSDKSKKANETIQKNQNDLAKSIKKIFDNKEKKNVNNKNKTENEETKLERNKRHSWAEGNDLGKSIMKVFDKKEGATPSPFSSWVTQAQENDLAKSLSKIFDHKDHKDEISATKTPKRLDNKRKVSWFTPEHDHRDEKNNNNIIKTNKESPSIDKSCDGNFSSSNNCGGSNRYFHSGEIVVETSMDIRNAHFKRIHYLHLCTG